MGIGYMEPEKGRKNQNEQICSRKIHLFLKFLTLNAPLFLGYYLNLDFEKY